MYHRMEERSPWSMRSTDLRSARLPQALSWCWGQCSALLLRGRRQTDTTVYSLTTLEKRATKWLGAEAAL